MVATVAAHASGVFGPTGMSRLELCASCSYCHAALGSDEAAFTVNQASTTPRARPRPVARKCSQDTRRGVFHRVFPQPRRFFYSRIPKTFISPVQYIYSAPLAVSVLNITAFKNKTSSKRMGSSSAMTESGPSE
jgi:hypothetical protein